MTIDPKHLDPSEVQAINGQASVLMKRGIALQGDPRRSAIEEALDCFNRALAMRLKLPIERDPVLGYGLAACWLNRADALVRLGEPGQLPVALHSYDQGIAVMLALPLGSDPRFPRRLAIGHQNRGLALQAQGASGMAAAIAAFTEAIAVLDHDHSALIPDRQYLRAAVWTNLANVRVADASAESTLHARHAAARAIALAAELERDDADAAEVGLKARHVFCQTVVASLSLPAIAGEPMPADVHEATDAADGGLALVRQWEQKGVTRFRGLAFDLFRFGARVYARYQPQFLQEFVRDNLDPDQSSAAYAASAEMQSAAEEALRLLAARPSD